MNKTKCVDCFNFKTRVIPNEEALKKDEFRSNAKLHRFFSVRRGRKAECRIYYCASPSWDRTPLVEGQAAQRRLIKTCNAVIK
jgi:hypothetical protein